MVKRFFAGLGSILLAILKGIAWLLLSILKLVLGLAKIFLLLFGLVGRVFLAFVRIGTPWEEKSNETQIFYGGNHYRRAGFNYSIAHY